MKAIAKKSKTTSHSTEVVSARLPRPQLAILRKIFPGHSNQTIIETLIEEKLARKHFETWLNELKNAHQAGALDLEKV